MKEKILDQLNKSPWMKVISILAIVTVAYSLSHKISNKIKMRKANQYFKSGYYALSKRILFEDLKSFSANEEYCRNLITSAVFLADQKVLRWTLEKCDLEKKFIPEFYWGMAVQAANNKKTKKAIKHINDGLEKYKDDVFYLKKASSVLRIMGLLKKANDLNKAILSKSDDKEFAKQSLKGFIDAKEYFFALTVLQTIGAPNQKDIFELLHFAKIYINTDQLSKAKEILPIINNLLKNSPQGLVRQVKKNFPDVLALKKERDFDPILERLNSNPQKIAEEASDMPPEVLEQIKKDREQIKNKGKLK